MLDLQRQKYAPHETSGSILFARGLLFAHLAAGVLVIALLLFHEFFAAAGRATGWYVLTLLAGVGMTKRITGSRLMLALLFFAAAASGLVFMIWVLPGLKVEREPLLSLRLLPFWLVIASFGYGAAAYVVAVSSRVRRACEKGFTLLDTPKPY